MIPLKMLHYIFLFALSVKRILVKKRFQIEALMEISLNHLDQSIANGCKLRQVYNRTK